MGSRSASRISLLLVSTTLGIPAMRSRPLISIVNFSSISYMMGNAGYPVYTTANSGINGMTRSLAREFGPENIRVNAIAPGWVLTQKQKDMWVTPEGLAAHIDRQCLKVELQPSSRDTFLLFVSHVTTLLIVYWRKKSSRYARRSETW